MFILFTVSLTLFVHAISAMVIATAVLPSAPFTTAAVTIHVGSSLGRSTRRWTQ
jgi:hypothetical protein